MQNKKCGNKNIIHCWKFRSYTTIAEDQNLNGRF